MRSTKIVIMLALIVSASFANAQIKNETKSTWKVQAIKGNFGAHADHFSNMNLGFMEGRINDASYKGVSTEGLTPEDFVYNTSGGNINLGVMLSRTPITTTIGKYETLELSVGAHFGREVMIDYYNNNPADFCGTNNVVSCYNDITFCDLQNEVSISATYRRGVSLANIINIYTGLGTSLGTTMGSKMWIFANEYNANTEQINAVSESYSLEESVLGRIYVPIGGELVIMNKLRFTAEGRLGVGYNHSFSQGGAGNLNYSVLGGLAWNI
ncbi:MAG: hypothetical protein ACPGLV_07270 [Bacteroidia bacterium]